MPARLCACQGAIFLLVDFRGDMLSGAISMPLVLLSAGDGASRVTIGGIDRLGGKMALDRITHNPAVMGGKPCIRGLRVTVGTILGLLAPGHSRERILKAYPYLEAEDIDAALAYAAWRLEVRKEEIVVT